MNKHKKNYTLFFYNYIGPPKITNLKLLNNVVICVSTGQLINQVEWYKNDLRITHSSIDFAQYQVLRDTTAIEYEHRLTEKMNDSLHDGTITCKLTDGIGRFVQRSLQLPVSLLLTI